jgi:hypothetical protein
MNTVRTGSHGNIRAVIYQDARIAGPRNVNGAASQLQQVAGV